MNRYTPDGSAILDAAGNYWPVETAHPLPLPDGIDDTHDDNGFAIIVFGPGLRQDWRSASPADKSTHWLARRPLPEVPRVMTQEELDREAYCLWLRQTRSEECASPFSESVWRQAIAYARQCPAKQEAKS